MWEPSPRPIFHLRTVSFRRLHALVTKLRLNVNARRAVLNEHFGQPFWNRGIKLRGATVDKLANFGW